MAALVKNHLYQSALLQEKRDKGRMTLRFVLGYNTAHIILQVTNNFRVNGTSMQFLDAAKDAEGILGHSPINGE
jgi:hypothetical protein